MGGDAFMFMSISSSGWVKVVVYHQGSIFPERGQSPVFQREPLPEAGGGKGGQRLPCEQPGHSSGVSSNTWSSTTSPPRWQDLTHCTAVSSPTQLEGQRFQWAAPSENRSPALVSSDSRNAYPRHHPPPALVVFQDEERHALLPWDGEPYEIADWRTAKVHPDHHVACQYALYSVERTFRSFLTPDLLILETWACTVSPPSSRGPVRADPEPAPGFPSFIITSNRAVPSLPTHAGARPCRDSRYPDTGEGGRD